MPKVTRRSLAAAAAAAPAPEAPTRDARLVFGDVSNNTKGQTNKATKPKRSSIINATNATMRRRSSRLAGADDPAMVVVETTTNIAVVCSGYPAVFPLQRPETMSNGEVPGSATAAVATRRSRYARNKAKDEKQSIPNIQGASDTAQGTTGMKKEAPTTFGTKSTRASRARQPSDEPTAVTVRPTRSTKQQKTITEEDPAVHVDPAPLPEEEDRKPAARKSNPRAQVESSQVAKLQVRRTRASKAQDQTEEGEALATYKPPPAAARKTRANKSIKAEPQDVYDDGTKILKVTAVSRTRASRGRAAKREEDEAAEAPAVTKKGGAKSEDATAKSRAAKPAAKTRGRSRGKAAAAADAAKESNSTEAKRTRTTRSTNTRGAAATTKPAAKGKASGNALNMKRARSQKPDQEPRKRARASRSKSTTIRVATRPRRVSNTTNLAPDFLKQDDFRLFRGDLPFDATKYTRDIAPADVCNSDKVEEVPEYVTDIMQRLFYREVATRPHPYMQEQPNLNTNMRSILIDWLVEVHMKFRLEQSTMYLCVNIIDRYLERSPTERSKLQLVGVTSLLVACKIEEIYPPEVRDCVYICDGAYTREQVLDMEATILRTLEYRVTAPTGFAFLNRFLHLTKATKLQKHAAHYYMERMLQEYTCLKHRPSLVAASCVSLALNNPSIRSYEGIRGDVPGVPNDLVEYTGFDVSKILEVAEKVSTKVRSTHVTNSRRELIAVKRKYESCRYQCVSSDFEEPLLDDILAAYD